MNTVMFLLLLFFIDKEPQNFSTNPKMEAIYRDLCTAKKLVSSKS